MTFENFTESDLLQLKPLEPEGWGDLKPRFRLLLDNAGCFPFKLTVNNTLAAVGATILFSESAWLACIITHPDFQRQGIGEKMTRYLINAIDMKVRPTISLIATPMGYPLYKKIGFITDSIYDHFNAVPVYDPSLADSRIRNYQQKDKEKILQLDHQLSGEDRSSWLMDYLKEASVFYEEEMLTGYYLPSLGEGFIFALNAKAGTALMNLRASTKQNAVIPQSNIAALSFMKAAGLQPFRISTRMYIGKKMDWDPKAMYNRIGGQLG